MLITGKPGVGKTLILNYLAYVILHRAPFGLKNRRVFQLKNNQLKALRILNKTYQKSCIAVDDEFHSMIPSLSAPLLSKNASLK